MWKGRPGEPGWVLRCPSQAQWCGEESPGLWRQRPTCATAVVRVAKQGTHTEMLQPLKFFKGEDEDKLPRTATLSLDYPLAFL